MSKGIVKPVGSAFYRTSKGRMYVGPAEEVLDAPPLKRLRGKFQLIFTSPPFSLIEKKSYGNHQGRAYIEWLAGFAELFRGMLTPRGSLVVELGNSWDRGQPTMSTVPLEALMALKERGEFNLCQEIIWNNPARLPSPAQWVNIDRIRLKDSFTRIWWMSTSTRPDADNRRVLVPYSDAMRDLLQRGRYNSGKRPCGAHVGQSSFLTDHGGAISSSVLPSEPHTAGGFTSAVPDVLHIANTRSNDRYRRHCRDHGLKIHDARMPVALAEFFIRFLTQQGDYVLDPFAGSNTTGFAAEILRRKWVAIEKDLEFATGSMVLFPKARRG